LAGISKAERIINEHEGFFQPLGIDQQSDQRPYNLTKTTYRRLYRATRSAQANPIKYARGDALEQFIKQITYHQTSRDIGQWASQRLLHRETTEIHQSHSRLETTPSTFRTPIASKRGTARTFIARARIHKIVLNEPFLFRLTSSDREPGNLGLKPQKRNNRLNRPIVGPYKHTSLQRTKHRSMRILSSFREQSINF
jgi:hypothetical protein